MSPNIVSSTEELTFGQLYHEIHIQHDPEIANDVIRKKCLESSSKDVQKKGMEFLYANGYFKDLEQLVEKNLLSEDPCVRKWADVFQIFLPQGHHHPTPLEIYNRIQTIEAKEYELKVLIKFARAHICHLMSHYNKMGDLISYIDDLLVGLEDPLFRKYMLERHNHLALIYTFSRNEIIISRKYAYKILAGSKNPLFLIDVHMKIGLSYLFESYSKGMYHFKEALQIAKIRNLDESIHFIEQKLIPFYSAHFGKTDGISSENKIEQAHIEIAKGNVEKAIEILEKYPLNTPEVLYYMGKAKKDKKLLLQAYEGFIEQQSHYFLCRLPLNEIKKL